MWESPPVLPPCHCFQNSPIWKGLFCRLHHLCGSLCDTKHYFSAVCIGWSTSTHKGDCLLLSSMCGHNRNYDEERGTSLSFHVYFTWMYNARIKVLSHPNHMSAASLVERWASSQQNIDVSISLRKMPVVKSNLFKHSNVIYLFLERNCIM